VHAQLQTQLAAALAAQQSHAEAAAAAAARADESERRLAAEAERARGAQEKLAAAEAQAARVVPQAGNAAAASTADAAEVARLRTALQVLGTAADGDCQQLIRLFAKVKPENASAEKVADLVTQFGSYTAVWAAVAQKYGEAAVAEYKPAPADTRAAAGDAGGRSGRQAGRS
jgi:hypothetical protein